MLEDRRGDASALGIAAHAPGLVVAQINARNDFGSAADEPDVGRARRRARLAEHRPVEVAQDRRRAAFDHAFKDVDHLEGGHRVEQRIAGPYADERANHGDGGEHVHRRFDGAQGQGQDGHGRTSHPWQRCEVSFTPCGARPGRDIWSHAVTGDDLAKYSPRAVEGTEQMVDTSNGEPPRRPDASRR